MYHLSIYLEEEQFRALKHLAEEQRQSVADVASKLVNDGLANRSVDDALWQQRFDKLLTRTRARVPEDATSEKIEADISLARDEVRRIHRAPPGH